MSTNTLQSPACNDVDVPSAFVELLRTHAAVTRNLSGQLIREHGLTANDYEALLNLAHAENGRLKRIELAQRLLLTPSGVTRLLTGLERLGLVEKGTCDSDARVTYAVLTERGRRKIDECGPSHVAAVRQLFEEHLDADELALLTDLLVRLRGSAVVAGCPGSA
jgi:DNA-binding MarR family transcriptional regulator